MSEFDRRWRALARSARGAPEASVPPAPAVEPLLVVAARTERPRPAAVPGAAGARSPWSRPAWVLPALVFAALNGLALPFLDRAIAASMDLRLSLRDIPRPPALPSPPVPAPPLLPRPPLVPRSQEALSLLFPEETRP
jgi:hypothetical protein